VWLTVALSATTIARSMLRGAAVSRYLRSSSIGLQGVATSTRQKLRKKFLFARALVDMTKPVEIHCYLCNMSYMTPDVMKYIAAPWPINCWGDFQSATGGVEM
jgi:hypothetical protein